MLVAWVYCGSKFHYIYVHCSQQHNSFVFPLLLHFLLSFVLSVTEPISSTVGQTDQQQLPTHNNSVQSQDTIVEEKTSPQTEPESDLFGAGVDSPDSGSHKGVAGEEEKRRRRRRTSSVRKTVMWVITEDNR